VIEVSFVTEEGRYLIVRVEFTHANLAFGLKLGLLTASIEAFILGPV
jgi:hypothetical protein